MKLFEKRSINLGLNFRQRKYRMLLWELILFILFLALNYSIGVMFPVVTENVLETDPSYGLYLLLALADIFLLGTIFFVAGTWFGSWYSEREIWKDDPNEP